MISWLSTWEQFPGHREDKSGEPNQIQQSWEQGRGRNQGGGGCPKTKLQDLQGLLVRNWPVYSEEITTQEKTRHEETDTILKAHLSWK